MVLEEGSPCLMAQMESRVHKLQIQGDDGGGSTKGDGADFGNALTVGGMIAETKILTSTSTDPVIAKTAAAQLIGQDLVGIAQGGDAARQAALENLLLDSSYAKTIGRGVSEYRSDRRAIRVAHPADAERAYRARSFADRYGIATRRRAAGSAWLGTAFP